MSMDWFRSWHGAPTDPKWLLIAKRSETQAGVVSAIVWALFDHASQNADDRGNVEHFDTETYAAFSGFDELSIKRVLECLKDKNIIIDGCLAAWEKRQVKREDNSTDRVTKHRNAVKRNETQRNAREEKSRIDKDEDKKEADARDETQKRVGDFRQAIVQAYAEAKSPNLPETSRAELWIAQGFEPDICLAVIAEQVRRKPSIGSLSYFDNAIAEAHAKKAPPRKAINGHAPLDWDAIFTSYKKFGHWSRDAGNDPLSPNCRAPPDILRKYGFEPMGTA